MHKRLAALICFLILTSGVLLLLPIPDVSATSVSTAIGQLSTSSGNVGTNVTLQGNITTENGQYHILFNNDLVLTNTSVSYAAVSVFTVPEISGGTYNVTLQDITTGDTANVNFTVTIGYNIEAIVPSSPLQLQEGNSVALNVNVTGGQVGTSYAANVTVVLPSSLGTNSTAVALSSTSANGTAQQQIVFPDDFSNATTNYVGTYIAYFNYSSSLAYDEFTIGLTNATQYHRNDTVQIQAAGYQSGENATLTITDTDTNTTFLTEDLKASSIGIISTDWTVPPNAPIDEYNVTIISQTTNKTVNDTQVFYISGYPIQVHTFNLAGEVVPSIDVQACDLATNITYNATSGSDGLASFNLELGDVVITAYYLGVVQVGQLNQTITGAATYDLTCNLTDINVTVENADGVLMRGIDLTLTFQYVSSTNGSSYNTTVQGQTDDNGNYVYNSTLTGINYIINASIYGEVFNIGNNTISSLPLQPVSDVTIICPTQNLTLTILDSTSTPIPNAHLTLIELTNGIFQNGTTNTNGVVSLPVTFGMYQLSVYSGDVLLKQTNIEVFNDSQITVQCSLYGIQVTVKVVDFFGQPVANANVTLSGPGNEVKSAITSSNGTVTFYNFIGGSMQVVAYPSGMENNYQTVSLTIDGSTTVPIKMGEFISLGSFMVATNAFTAFILVLASLLLFLFIEIFRRRKVVSTTSLNVKK